MTSNHLINRCTLPHQGCIQRTKIKLVRIIWKAKAATCFYPFCFGFSSSCLLEKVSLESFESMTSNHLIYFTFSISSLHTANKTSSLFESSEKEVVTFLLSLCYHCHIKKHIQIQKSKLILTRILSCSSFWFVGALYVAWVFFTWFYFLLLVDFFYFSDNLLVVCGTFLGNASVHMCPS